MGSGPAPVLGPGESALFKVWVVEPLDLDDPDLEFRFIQSLGPL